MRYTVGHNTEVKSKSLMNWLLLPLLLLCLTACSSDDDEALTEQNPEAETETDSKVPGKVTPTKLWIYVYKPNTAVPTRAYTGDVNPIGREDVIYLLQIWVFTHTSNKLIGYFSSAESSALNTGDNYEIYQLTVDETYAQTAELGREHVDVYVLANVSTGNCNLELGHTTTRAELEAALLKKTSSADPFGMTSPVREVQDKVGLPMSGVLRNQPVTGAAPVLRIDDGGELAKVRLIRTVSKLRFAFSRQTGSEPLQINSIQLNTEMIPKSEYLIMAADAPYDRHTCHIKTDDGYNTATPNLLDEAITDVPANDDPTIYAWGYEELEPQAYEDLIDDAAEDGYLTQRLFYLRESDKLLQGTIKYQIDGGEEQTATFRMVDTGGFSRNHIWTVYAYQAQAHLQVVVAEVAPWRLSEENHNFYNW